MTGGAVGWGALGLTLTAHLTMTGRAAYVDKISNTNYSHGLSSRSRYLGTGKTCGPKNSAECGLSVPRQACQVYEGPEDYAVLNSCTWTDTQGKVLLICASNGPLKQTTVTLHSSRLGAGSRGRNSPGLNVLLVLLACGSDLLLAPEQGQRKGQ